MSKIILKSSDNQIILESYYKLILTRCIYDRTENSTLGFCDSWISTEEKEFSYEELADYDYFKKFRNAKYNRYARIERFIIKLDSTLDDSDLINRLNYNCYEKTGITFELIAGNESYKLDKSYLIKHYYRDNNLILRFGCCGLFRIYKGLIN